MVVKGANLRTDALHLRDPISLLSVSYQLAVVSYSPISWRAAWADGELPASSSLEDSGPLRQSPLNTLLIFILEWFVSVSEDVPWDRYPIYQLQQ